MDFRAYEVGKCYQDFRIINGSKLYEQDGRLFLVISYDDILDYEVDAFQNAQFEVVFKTFGLISLFTFKFREHIVDAPFNPFTQNRRYERVTHERRQEIPLIIFICEFSTGEVLGKREVVLPEEFCLKWARLLAERYEEYIEQYNFWTFNEGIKEIYDNHVIEALYELPGDREIRCFV